MRFARNGKGPHGRYGVCVFRLTLSAPSFEMNATSAPCERLHGGPSEVNRRLQLHTISLKQVVGAMARHCQRNQIARVAEWRAQGLGPTSKEGNHCDMNGTGIDEMKRDRDRYRGACF